MHFGSPHFLWLLLLAPLQVAFFWWAWRTRQRLMQQFIRARLLPGLLAGVSPARQKARLALVVAATLLVVAALARPQWGFGWEEVKQRGLDIVVALDTSRSMVAQDVAPSRLERAKLEALALKQLCRYDRLGLVAFAGTAFLQCPLSLDDEAFRQSLEALNVNIIPQGGTALAEAVRTALPAFKEKSENHKILVVFTDGEDHEGDAVAAAKEAAEQGLRIFTIGVGTPAGELLALAEESGQRGYIKDEQGQVIKSHLNEPLLQEMASVAGGFYLPLSGAKTMDTLFERGLKPLPKGEFDGKARPVYFERFQWFLGLAVVALLVEIFLPDARRSQGAGASRAAAVSALVLLGWLAAPSAEAASAGKALKHYQRGNYDGALREYEKLADKKPDDPRLHFNAGAAAFQAKEYDTALKQLGASLATPDVKLQEQAYYNLGNTRFRLGEEESDPEKRKNHWEQATSSYESALKLEAKDEDTRFNLELVKKKLEELKQQQQQQKNDKQDDKNKDDKDKQDKSQQQKKDDQKQPPQDKPDDQKKQDQQQQQDKQDQQQSQSNPSKEDKEKDEEQEAANAGKPMQMTPQQARQLLDTLKTQEKPMIFVPPQTNRTDRHFKNW